MKTITTEINNAGVTASKILTATMLGTNQVSDNNDNFLNISGIVVPIVFTILMTSVIGTIIYSCWKKGFVKTLDDLSTDAKELGKIERGTFGLKTPTTPRTPGMRRRENLTPLTPKSPESPENFLPAENRENNN